MRKVALTVMLLGAGAFLCLPAAQPADPGTYQVKLGVHNFTLPVGFEIEQVAGPPLVNRPIVADFDDQGRLYAADSSGTNDPVEQQMAKKPHRVVRLEDSKGTGHFDKQTVYAEHLMFPEGAMWRDGSLYVAAVPSILKLTDTKGNGVADQRSEWFHGRDGNRDAWTGCANDLHGPYNGPDGWIYWTKGAFAKETIERPGNKPFVTRAAHIFRARPDGTGIEPVMTGGMDNPVEVAFTAGGERIFTTTFFQFPGGGRRDGLIHAIYGGIYGKDHPPIYEHPWTGPSVMPVLTHFGPAAPSGLVRYEGTAFGPEFQDNLFATQFNMQKVSRHILTPQGATFACKDEDFLVSDNHDFHPTDVLEDADGSLLVVDTGGWYKLCCPSSQLHKPDILGAIYRVRRKGAAKIDDPRGNQIAWATTTPDELARLLGDPRHVVRKRAIAALASRGKAAIPALEETLKTAPSAEAKRNALWCACRIDATEARPLARGALADSDETVRQVALHCVSVRRDTDATAALLLLLESGSKHNQRAAAEALGRVASADAVPALLRACSQPVDRALEHSRIFALIEIGQRDTNAKAAIAAGLKESAPKIQRAALIALDQLGAAPLEAVKVALSSPDASMKEAAWWIAVRHPDWGGALADILKQRFSAPLTEAERAELIDQLARFANAEPVQKFLAERLQDGSAPLELRKLALRAMAGSRVRDVPLAWAAAIVEIFKSDRPELIADALATVRGFRPNPRNLAPFLPGLEQTADNTKLPALVRLTALAAMPESSNQLKPELFTLAMSQLAPDKPVAERGLAAEVLSRARLTPDQLNQVVDMVKVAGALELDRLLDACAASKDEAVGRRLITALQAASGRSSLRPESLKPRLAKFGPNLAPEAQALYALLDKDLAEQRAQLDDILTHLGKGDIRRGQLVFNNQKTACISCHSIGYVGGKLGPDLTRIGRIRSERDLLESIVFPSASFVRSYEPVAVATKSGKVYNGLIRRDTPEEIVLALSGTEEVRLPRSDIDEIGASKVSVMPAGLEKQLSKQELADLVTFLKACQ